LFISFIHLEALIHSTLVLMMMTLHEAQKSTVGTTFSSPKAGD